MVTGQFAVQWTVSSNLQGRIDAQLGDPALWCSARRTDVTPSDSAGGPSAPTQHNRHSAIRYEKVFPSRRQWIPAAPFPITMSLLLNKIVVVTGSSSGIGRATAIGESPFAGVQASLTRRCRTAASRHGADVVLHHLGESTLEDTQAVKQVIESNGRKAILVAGDIGDPETAKSVSPFFPPSSQP
jgi:hypothetical protein